MSTEERTGAEYDEGCQTEVKTVKFDYKWIVCDFRKTFNKTRGMAASSFAIKDCPMTVVIGINPVEGGCVNGSQTHARIYASFTRTRSTSPTIHTIHTEAFVIDSEGMKRFIFAEDVHGYQDSYPYRRQEYLSCSHELPVDFFVSVVENENVTLYFSFEIEMLSSAPQAIEPVIQVPMPMCSSAYNFSKLLEDPKFSDVTITVGSKIFNVHRVILANRSSVFTAMFEHKMKENESSNVDITDISEEAVEEMLKFIYTNKTDTLEDMTNELLDAAEKYDLGTLKDLCDHCIRKNLNVCNAAESLILADRYNLEETKTKILKFISKHRKSVEETDGYKVMREKHLNLVVETYEIK